MTTQIQLLTLGAFDLFGDGDTWRCETLADGTDLSGNPVPVEVAIQTLIQDGSVAFTEKFDNATIPIHVRFLGPDSEALDDAIAALFSELERPNVLTYQGPHAFEPIAWDVVNSHLVRNSDDLGEVRGERDYTIELTVLPFRRSTEETVTPALATGATSQDIDNGSSTSGWTGKSDGTTVTPTSSGGAVRVASPAPESGSTFLVASRTGASEDTSTTKYVYVDWAVSGATASMSAAAGGTSLSKVGELASPTAGYTRTYFYVAASSFTNIEFTALALNGSTTTRELAITHVGRTNTVPGGPKQQVRSIDIGGSVRTPGTVAIEHESSALGDVLAYFWPDDGTGYSPPMRQYRVSGSAPSSSSSYVSGFRDDIKANPTVYEVPAGKLPRDEYRLYARLVAASSADAVVTWALTSLVNSVDVGPTLGQSRTVALTTSFRIVCLDLLELPTRDMELPAPLGKARLTLSATSAASGVYVDEAWLIGDRGREVLISAGAGTPSAGGPANRVWLDAPTLDNPRPRILRGYAADRSDAFHAYSIGAWRFPEFVPPRVNVMTVTTNADDAAVSFRHYERKAG